MMSTFLSDKNFLNNPAQKLSELREQGPLLQIKFPFLGKVWITTDHSTTQKVLKDAELFRQRGKSGKLPGMSWFMPKLLTRLADNMLSSDEPDHTRLRTAVDSYFHQGRIAELDKYIDEKSRQLLEKLFHSQKSIDFHSAYSRLYPVAIISYLLGLPEGDQRKFLRWAEGLSEVTGLLSFLKAAYNLKPLARYIEEITSTRVKELNPNSLVFTLMNNSEIELTQDEMVAMVFLLLMAGHETTTHLITGSLFQLLTHKEQLEQLRSNQNLLKSCVEECLRFVSPVMFTKPRIVKKSISLQGVSLAAGETVMPMLIGANYDPDVFEKPEVFDITRKPNRHIEFGTGIHFCLGHQLAKAELAATLKNLFHYYPDIDLIDQDPDWNKRLGWRTLKNLNLQVS